MFKNNEQNTLLWILMIIFVKLVKYAWYNT